MNDLLLRALRGEPTPRPPIWMMRQAGRVLPEYRELRSRHDFNEVCRTPELATEVTLQPVDRLGVDAAILFSDILVPVAPMGFEIEFNPGPVLDRPVRGAADVERLRVIDPEDDVPFVYDAIRMLRRELAGRVPLIGFAGAPFTLAVYLIEGRGSKHFEHMRTMMFGAPDTLHALLDKITRTSERYLAAQARAGAQAVQLFDTWAGLLSPDEFGEFALPYAQRVLRAAAETGVPRIYFALNNAHLLDAIGDCDAEAIGIDWRTPLAEANRRLGGRYALQGNLDPGVLMSNPERIARCAAAVIEQGRDAPGHVFNLGHGILPMTPLENARALVDAVRAHGSDG